jgi:hypothetical protein
MSDTDLLAPGTWKSKNQIATGNAYTDAVLQATLRHLKSGDDAVDALEAALAEVQATAHPPVDDVTALKAISTLGDDAEMGDGEDVLVQTGAEGGPETWMYDADSEAEADDVTVIMPDDHDEEEPEAGRFLLVNAGALPDWLVGAGVPRDATDGKNGDMYLRTSNGAVYGPKAAGAWGASVANITGPQGAEGLQGDPGADGASILSGAGAPGAGVGENGDSYINTTNGDVYGPKTGGAWGDPTGNIKGDQGDPGADAETVVGQIVFAGADAGAGAVNVSVTSITSGYVPAAGDKIMFIVGAVTATGVVAEFPVTGTDIALALVDAAGVKARWLLGDTSLNGYTALMVRPAA